MNDFLTFNNPDYGEIRTLIKDGEPWFIVSDLCKILEVNNISHALSRIDDDEKGIVLNDTPGGTQKMAIVNEPGLYTLVLSSRKKETKSFKRWVTHEVLPSIRKTGAYSVAPTALPMTTAEQIKLLAKSDTEIREDVENIKGNVSDMKSEIDTLKDTMPLFPADADLISEAVKRKGVDVLGGKASEAYKDKGLKMSVFKDIYGQIHRNFGVKSYKSIRHKDCQNVLDVVSSYVLPLTLKERIHDANLQLTFV